jgi:hypothetical protein
MDRNSSAEIKGQRRNTIAVCQLLVEGSAEDERVMMVNL